MAPSASAAVAVLGTSMPAAQLQRGVGKVADGKQLFKVTQEQVCDQNFEWPWVTGPVKSEADVYGLLGLPCYPPRDRDAF